MLGRPMADPQVRRSRRLTLMLGLMGLCAVLALPSRSSAPSAGLALGDCVAAPTGGHGAVVEVACTAPAAVRIAAAPTFPAAADEPYPGRDQLDAYAAARCEATAGPVTATVTPTAASWAAGDRALLCLAEA